MDGRCTELLPHTGKSPCSSHRRAVTHLHFPLITLPVTKFCRKKKANFSPLFPKPQLPPSPRLAQTHMTIAGTHPVPPAPTSADPRMFYPRDPDHPQQLWPLPPPRNQELKVISEIWSRSHRLCCTSLHSLSFISPAKGGFIPLCALSSNLETWRMLPQNPSVAQCQFKAVKPADSFQQHLPCFINSRSKCFQQNNEVIYNSINPSSLWQLL